MNLSLKPATLIYIGWILWILMRRENAIKKYLSLYIFAAFTEIFLNLGYLFSVGSFEVNYSYISLGITVLYGTILQSKHKIKFLSKTSLIFICVVCIGMFVRIISPVEIYGIDHYMVADDLFNGVPLVKLTISPYSYITLIKVLMLIYTTSIFSKVYQREKFFLIIKKYIPIFEFYVIFAIVEFTINNIAGPSIIRDIVLAIFGSQKASAALPYYRMGLYSILLTCNEPSLTSYVLLFCIIGLLWGYIQTGKKGLKNLALLGVMMMVLSLTLTGIIFSILVIYIYIDKREKKQKRLNPNELITIGLVLCLFVLIIALVPDLRNYFWERISRVFTYIGFLFSNSTSNRVFTIFGASSEAVRMYSIFQGLTVFLKTPLLGVGLGTENVCSGWVSVLSQIGIIGTYYWIKMMNKWLVGCEQFKCRKAFILLMIAYVVQGGMTDILTSTYYFVLLMLINGVLNGNVIKDNKMKYMYQKEVIV